MRDTQRIDRILEKISRLWHKYPDMRFWQLLVNIPWKYRGDMFFIEDDRTEAAIDEILEKGF